MTPFELLLFKLFYSFIIGGCIGAEREYRSKSAGFRTMILICVGSFLFTTFSIHIGTSSPDRIASNILTGIGFIGAGVIFRSDDGINGITTAASIWITAALGIGIAADFYWLVLATTILVLVLLFLFTRLEAWIDSKSQYRKYKIVTNYHHHVLSQYEKILTECGLKHKRIKRTRLGENISALWVVSGSEKEHDQFVERILSDQSVKEFEF